MADLPDYYTRAAIAEAEAASFKGGLDANKSPIPVSRQIYFGTDTGILYICVIDGVWTGFDASILTQGILTLYANMVAGNYRLTGLGAPTTQDDALRYGRAEIRNTEIKGNAAIVESKLSLAQGTQALFDKIGTDITTHKDIVAAHHAATVIADLSPIALSDIVNTYLLPTIMTNRGDIVIRGTANPVRLAKGTEGHFLRQGPNVPAWAALDIVNAQVNASAAIAYSKLDLATAILFADMVAAEFNVANKFVKLDASADVPDAQIPSLAASKITSGRFPVNRLPAMTDEFYWVGTGTNVEERAAPNSMPDDFANLSDAQKQFIMVYGI